MVKKISADKVSLFIFHSSPLFIKGTPPPKERQIFMGSHRIPLVALVPLVACMVSDGCLRQRTSETFPISRTEFKKSFLLRQAQSIVILITGYHAYGMAMN
jgi:hypothetical protein